MFKTGEYTSKTGTTTWTGFAAGVGDDMADPDVGRKYFMTQDFGALMSVNVNRDTGVMNGTVTMTEPFTDSGATTTIGGATLGGTFGSAYVSDELFVFEMGGAGVVNTVGYISDLNNHGSYFFPEDPAEQVSEWAKWGTWESAFTDGLNFKNYHIHNPDAYWVLGQMTPASTVLGLVSSSAVGNYTGLAFCTEIVPGTGQNRSTGTADFTVDFGARSVSGDMLLPDYKLSMIGTVRTDGAGVEGTITNVLKNTTNYTPTNSSVRAGFFGPGAVTFGGTHLTDLGPGKEKFVGGFITNGTPAVP
jgi:hypothetical protein